MIIRSRVVATMDGEPIEDGAVAIEANQIADVGRFAEVKRCHSGEVVDLGEQILLPGLINAHCHLDYTMLRGRIPPQRSFADWIREINTHKAALTESDYIESIAAGLTEAQSFGTTTILNLEAFPELLPRIAPPALRVWWCAEMIDLRQPLSLEKVAGPLRGWFRAHPDWLGGFGLAPHAPFTASVHLYTEASRMARQEGVPFTTHLAESAEEMQMFRDASGALYDFLEAIDCRRATAGSATPLSFILRSQEIDERWIIAHLNELDATDFELLKNAPRFQIAHCPRSHSFLGHGPFALQSLRALGFNICLGTDSLASNSSLSLFAEMRELLSKEAGLSPREVLEMVTIYGARAIGRAELLGRIRVGFLADLIALPCKPSQNDVFETIVNFGEMVPWLMINGEVNRRP